MALIKGVCKNFGECDLADNKEIQEVEKSNFVCEECGKPLHAIDGGGHKSGGGKGSSGKVIALIAGAVAAVGAVGGGIYALLSGDESEGPAATITLNHTSKTFCVGESDTLTATVAPEGTLATIAMKAQKDGAVMVEGEIVKAVKEGTGKVLVMAFVGKDTLKALCDYTVTAAPQSEAPKLALNHKTKTMKVNESDTLVVTFTPAGKQPQYVWTVSDDKCLEVKDGIVKAKQSGKAEVRVQAILDNTVTADTCTYTIEESKKKVNDGGNTGAGNGRGTLDLGYATYSGDIRNGKPEGAGLMTYKSSRKAGRDFSTDEAVYAEKGDRVDGVWTNGFLSTGTLYKKDGNVIKIRY